MINFCGQLALADRLQLGELKQLCIAMIQSVYDFSDRDSLLALTDLAVRFDARALLRQCLGELRALCDWSDVKRAMAGSVGDVTIQAITRCFLTGRDDII